MRNYYDKWELSRAAGEDDEKVKYDDRKLQGSFTYFLRYNKLVDP